MAENGRTEVVVISGAQTLPRIADTHAAILLQLSKHRSISIDCSTVTEVDMSFVQLLLSAQRLASADDKCLSLSEPPSGPFLAALERGGFLTSSEKSPSDERAFWRHADRAA